MNALVLLLVVLISAVAAARVFRLLTKDGITWPLRNGIQRLNWGWLNEGWFCPFCMGFWVSLAFVWTGLVTFDIFTWWGLVAGTLAANYVAAAYFAAVEED